MSSKKIIFLSSLILIIFTGAVTAAGQMKVSGTNSFGAYYGHLGNKSYPTVFAEEYASDLNLKEEFLLQGKMGSFDFNGIGELFFNKHDNFNIQRLMFELSRENLTINLGDVYSQQTALSLYNLKVQGLGIKYNYEIQPSKITLDSFEPYFKNVINGKNESLKGSFVTNYKESFTKDYLIKNIKFTFVGGLSNDLSTSGSSSNTEDPPDQYLYSLRADMFFDEFTKLGIGVITAKDDDDTPSSFAAQKGNSFSLDFNKTFKQILTENDNMYLNLEVASSDYDNTTKDTTPSQTDEAYKIDLEYRLNNFNSRLDYYNYGEDFKTLGNPYLITDKEGIDLNLSYEKSGMFYSNLYYSNYENNLNDDIGDTTTKTNIISPSLTLYLKNFPDLTFRYQKTDEEYPYMDLYTKDELFITARGKLGFGNINYSINYNTIDYEDNLYSDSSSYDNNAFAISLNYAFLQKRLSILNYLYKDKFEYTSGNTVENLSFNLNVNYMSKNNKIIVNGLYDYRASKDKTLGYTQKVRELEGNLKYIVSYKSSLGFKAKYKDEENQTADANQEAYVVGVDYSINF